MEKNSKIYIAGHKGLLGSAIKRELEQQGYTNLTFRNSSELDLRDVEKVKEFFYKENPEYVFIAAAKVGGIKSNMESPVDFLLDNIKIQNNIIEVSHNNKVKKLLFVASNCIYPSKAEQPFKEESLLTGEFEKTNEAFAIAKITGIKMCQAYNSQYGDKFITVIPASLFGPNDNFDIEKSHLIPALIRKVHEAKINNQDKVELWGSGNPRREVMYVEDSAKSCIFLMNNYEDNRHINAGIGEDYSVKELAEFVKEIVGYKGDIIFDTTKPDGMMRKLIASDKIKKLGWNPKIGVKEGLKKTYEWFKENEND